MLHFHLAIGGIVRPRRRCRLLILAAAIAGVVAAPLAARANTASSWIHSVGGNASGSWAVPQNWSAGIPNGPGDIADFDALNLTTTSTVTLDGDRTVGTMYIGDVGPTGPAGWIFAPGTPANSTLTLSNPGGTPLINLAQPTGVFSTITAPLGGTQGFVMQGIGDLILAAPPGTGTITGTIYINAQNGALRLGQDEQFADTASISGGFAQQFFLNGHNETINNLTAFTLVDMGTGTGVLKVNGTLTMDGFGGGRVLVGAGTTLDAANVVFTGPGPTSITGAGTIKLHGDINMPLTFGQSVLGAGGVVDLGGATRTFNVNGDPLVAGGILSVGSALTNGGLVKTGIGEIDLNRSSTYAGPTVIKEGSVWIQAINALNPASALTLEGAFLGLRQSQTFTSPQFTLGPGGSVLSVRDGSTLTLPNNWSRAAGATLFVNLSSPGNNTVISSPLPPAAAPGPTTPVLGWAWVKDKTGNGFATVDGTGHVVRYTAAAPITASTNGSTLTMDPATNYDLALDANLTLAANSTPTANSLAIRNNTGTARTLNLGGKTLAVSSGGLIVDNATAALDVTLDNGTLGAPNAELLVHKTGGGNLLLGPNLQLTGETGSVVFDGELGSVFLQGNTSTFSGGVRVHAGAMVVANVGSVSNGNTLVSGPFGTGTLTLGGGAIRAGNAPVRIDNPVALEDNTVLLPGGQTLTLGGPVTLRGSVPGLRTTTGSSIVFAGPIGEQAPGTQLMLQNPDSGGGGMVTLNGANTYTGLTTVSGTTLVLNGSVAGSVSVPIGRSGTLSTLRGGGTIGGDLTFNSGNFSPGDPVGTLTVNGNAVVNASNTWDFVTSAIYDRLNVGGSATIAGTLALNRIVPLTPSFGDTFHIVTAASRAGTFSTITGVNSQSAPGFSLAVTYTPTEVLVTAALPGDINLDKTVGPNDFNILASNFGTLSGQTWSTGDLDGDGRVGPSDFNLLASHFGMSVSGGAVPISAADWAALEGFGAANVPEPAGAAVGALALALLASRRRRSWSRSRAPLRSSPWPRLSGAQFPGDGGDLEKQCL